MQNDKIIKDLKELLLKHYSAEIDRIIFFGSRTRGDSEKYSDYDILIILKNDYDWRLEDKILSLCYEIDLKHNILTDVKIISNQALNSIRGKQPFITDALEKGVSV